MIDLKLISSVDPETAAAMGRELKRQRDNIELIASENFVSPAVMAAVGSHLTNKYAEGYSGKRYYGGCVHVDEVEDLAIERAKKLFGCNFANVQPHSGANANLAVYFALLEVGDTVLGMNLAHGGHLTHGSPVNFSGKNYNIVPYGVSDETETIDYDALEKLAKEKKPKMIIAGASAYSRVIDFKRFREIADSVGAYLMVDVAHIAGLIVTGNHPSPFPYAHVVTTTTHKTLRGPRGGMIMCNDEEIAKKINKAVFPGTQGGPLMHVIAGKAVALREAMTPEFKAYQTKVKENAAIMAAEFVKEGISLVSGGRQSSHAFETCRAQYDRQRNRSAARPLPHNGKQKHHTQRPAVAVYYERYTHRHAERNHSRHGRNRNENHSLPNFARYKGKRRGDCRSYRGSCRTYRKVPLIRRLRGGIKAA